MPGHENETRRSETANVDRQVYRRKLSFVKHGRRIMFDEKMKDDYGAASRRP